MIPERKGNRMDSTCDTSKIRDLGWLPQTSVKDYILKKHYLS